MENAEQTVDLSGTKVSKVNQFFEAQKLKFKLKFESLEKDVASIIQTRMDGYNIKLDQFINSANAAIKKSDDKFSQMYGVLVRQFLTSLENRLYTAELANKTVLLLMADKFHKIESDLNKLNAEFGTSLSKEEYLKELEAMYVAQITAVHKATEEDAAKQQEVKNEEATQEVSEPVQEKEEAQVDQQIE
jgi:hypothetical protein